jgi:ribosome-associated protein
MPRHEDPNRRAPRRDPGATPDQAPGDAPDAPLPSKTRRKAEMHALQDLGEAMVALDSRRMDELAAEVDLPERLVDAVRQARSITAWGGRKRQMQFIGKLMRDLDDAPIRHRLDAWAQGRDIDVARQHALERWRDRLLAEADALDALAVEFPRLDRPRLRALVARARQERVRGGPPHAYRELFRELKNLAGGPG